MKIKFFLSSKWRIKDLRFKCNQIILYGTIRKLLKTVIDVVETPIAIVKDAATMGGELTDQKKCYTQQKLEEIDGDWNDTKEQIKKL